MEVASGDLPSGGLASGDFPECGIVGVVFSGFGFDFDDLDDFDDFDDFDLEALAGTGFGGTGAFFDGAGACFGWTGACCGWFDVCLSGVDLPDANLGDVGPDTIFGGVDFPDVGPDGTGLPDGGIAFNAGGR